MKYKFIFLLKYHIIIKLKRHFKSLFLLFIVFISLYFYTFFSIVLLYFLPSITPFLYFIWYFLLYIRLHIFYLLSSFHCNQVSMKFIWFITERKMIQKKSRNFVSFIYLFMSQTKILSDCILPSIKLCYYSLLLVAVYSQNIGVEIWEKKETCLYIGIKATFQE